MIRILMMLALSLALVGCDKQDKVVVHAEDGKDVDNTELNIRDRDSMTKTPFDQSESEQDRKITQKIRQALVSDAALSTNAKNIKIITINGVVTLRGPVASPAEREAILKKIKDIAEVVRVENQLEASQVPSS